MLSLSSYPIKLYVSAVLSRPVITIWCWSNAQTIFDSCVKSYYIHVVAKLKIFIFYFLKFYSCIFYVLGMTNFNIRCVYFLFFHSDQLHHMVEWQVLSLKYIVRIECCERECWLQIAFKHIYVWVIAAAIMMDFYGEHVLKTRWRRYVYWIFVKKLRLVKFCKIPIRLRNLHKFK